MYFVLPFFLLATLLNAELVERTQVAMGTFVTITVDEKYREQQQKGFELIKAVENALSSYAPQADIYRLNHVRSVRISPYTYEALLLSQKYYKVSSGYFDISVGSITKGLYHFGEEERVAGEKELAKAHVNFSGVHFTTTQAWLDKKLLLDLGGMGKGFGVDKVASYLRANKITKGKVALSGDIRCLDTCTMAIQNPFGEGIVATFTTKEPNTAISTSGNYRRFIVRKEHNHLINPKTKASQQLFASITLLSHGPNSDIDAYATAASVMPLHRAVSFLDSLSFGYVLITNNGDQYVSENLGDFVTLLQFTQRVPFTCETE